MMFWSIDRFEGAFAVVEDDQRKTRQIERTLLPPEAKEGDVLKMSDGRYEIDREETERRRKVAIRLQDSLWE